MVLHDVLEIETGDIFHPAEKAPENFAHTLFSLEISFGFQIALGHVSQNLKMH